MVPIPPAAPVNTMRREGSLTSAILGSFHEVSVTLQRARQVFAHRSPRIGRIAIGNRRHDAGVLPLDTLQIGPPFAGCVNRQPHALTGNDVAAQEGEKTRKLPIPRPFRPPPMDAQAFSTS